jgi:alpha-L-fucosidase
VTDAPWWDDARYGLFVHWGVMSLPARGDWIMQREHIPVAEYERLGERFTAEAWDPAEQAALARQAGMRYAVLVTRHHDGFCLWDTATDHFKATNTPAGRDLVAEWVDAFRAAGLRVGLYYSLLDWRADAYWRGPSGDPDGWGAFREHVHAQLRELLTGYGEVATLWYDGFWPHPGRRGARSSWRRWRVSSSPASWSTTGRGSRATSRHPSSPSACSRRSVGGKRA